MGDELRNEILAAWEEFEISQKPVSVEGHTEFFNVEGMADAAHELKTAAWKAAARIEALEAENARLRSALEPFADACKYIGDARYDDDDAPSWAPFFYIGQFKAARAAQGDKA